VNLYAVLEQPLIGYESASTRATSPEPGLRSTVGVADVGVEALRSDGLPCPRTSSLVQRTSTASARTSSAGRSPAQSAPLGPACPPALAVPPAPVRLWAGRPWFTPTTSFGGHSCPRGALRKPGWSQRQGKVPSVSRGTRQPHHLL